MHRMSTASKRSLNQAQTEAVGHLKGPLLVLAGAGSGKTLVIVEKLKNLIVSNSYPPERVAAITFTQKAAREMRARAAARLGDSANKITISTFHSLGLQILKSEFRAAGLRSGFSILDPDSARMLIAQEPEGHHIKSESIAAAQQCISKWKTDLIQPDTVQNEPFGSVYADYERRLRITNAVDFDDLIGRAVQVLEQEPDVGSRWREKFLHILVDEYQDTNNAQYRLFKALCLTTKSFSVVGDDDQSIYAWRGANPENLRLLERDFPELQVIVLDKNYRSTTTILAAANSLISNNSHLYHKELSSDLGEGEPIRVFATRDADSEARRVTAAVLDLLRDRQLKPHDIAILYRGNYQSKPFERALSEAHVPYQVSGGVSWLDRSEVKDILAYLRLLTNLEDDAAFLRIVNTPRRNIGLATVEQLANYASERGIALFTACFEIGLKSRLPERSAVALRKFAESMSQLADHGETESATDVITMLMESIDYHAWLGEVIKDTRSRKRRENNIQELIEWIGGGPKESLLRDRLRVLAVGNYGTGESDTSADDRLHLMTIHASKGLEFPAVFLTGMEEGLLPHQNGIDEKHIDEERRLAYVALTRARAHLHISFAEARKRFGDMVDSEPSRFLSELPESLLRWERPNDEGSELRRQVAAQVNLAALRKQLGT